MYLLRNTKHIVIKCILFFLTTALFPLLSVGTAMIYGYMLFASYAS